MFESRLLAKGPCWICNLKVDGIFIIFRAIWLMNSPVQGIYRGGPIIEARRKGKN